MAVKKKTIKSMPPAKYKADLIHRGVDGDKTTYIYDRGDGTSEMWTFNSDGTVAFTNDNSSDVSTSNNDNSDAWESDVLDTPRPEGLNQNGQALLDRYQFPTSMVKDEDRFIGDTNIGKKPVNKSKSTSPNINAKTFASAFKQARTAGLDTFTWKGKQYGTRYKNESKSDNTTEKSSNTMSSKLTFGKAFDKARREGLSTFIWRGKKYGTKLKGE